MAEPENPDLDRFIDAVGRLTLSWATLELGLDICALAVHRYHREARTDPELPRALGRKLRYLRKAFETLPEMASARESFLKVMDDIEKSAEVRHDMIHGIVNEVLPDGIKMTRMLREADGYRPKQFTVTVTDILREAVRVNNMGSLVLSTGMLLHGRDPETGRPVTSEK